MNNHKNHLNELYFIFLLVIFFYSKSYTQNKNPIQSIIELNISEAQRINEINSIIAIFEKTRNDSLHFYYHDYASWLFDISKKDKAISFEIKAFELAKSKSKIDSSFLQESSLYLGYYYRKNQNIMESIKEYNKAANYNKNSENTIKAYRQLGFSYKKNHDYHKALSHFELAYSLMRSNNSRLQEIRNITANIGTVCQIICSKKSLRKGIYYCKIADSISKVIPTSNNTNLYIKRSLASLYNQHQTLDIQNSLRFYKEALSIAKQVNNTYMISEIYREMGNLYNTTNQKKSIEYLNKSLFYTSKSDSLELYKLYYNFSLTYAFGNDNIKSIEYGHRCLDYLIANNIKNHLSIDYNIFINTKHKKKLLHILPNLAETYLKYYEETKDLLLLEKSIAYFKLADFVIDLLKINSSEYKSKLFWRELSTDIYGKAIRACYLRNDIEEAFYFMEKNKALLLMEDIATRNYRHSLEIAPKFLEREEKMKQKLLLIKNKISFTSENIDSLKKAQVDLNRKLVSFQDSIYPNKNTLKEPPILSLTDIKNNLTKDEVFIEYHISIDDGYGIYSNNENAYVVFVSDEKDYFFEIPNQSILKEEVTIINSLLKKPFTTEEDITYFRTISHSIYNKLFPTKEIKELIKNKKLSIVTDSYLSLIPFESLGTKTNTTNYLIENNNISYLYSFSFLQNNSFKINTNNSLLGFAPVSFTYDNLSPLNNTKEEINYLKDYYKGELYMNDKATKAKFIEKFPHYSIIHLATHADAQDSISPWIAFSDEKLTLDELYLNNSKASLVVLSGCNTTLGKEEIGEGIMSLARGFFYSGSQSVISSLWNVDDTATPKIMNSFYKNLNSGQTKSEALRSAKLSYLKNHSLSEASPHYWASFVLLGKDDVLTNSNVHWSLYIAIILLVSLSILVIRRIQKTSRK